MIDTFEKCIEKRKLRKIGVQHDLIKKELESSRYDAGRAEFSLSHDDPKWATVQAYYSMFHTAKALVLSKGYKEKSHPCLAIALEKLFSDRIEAKHFSRLKDCMEMRYDADYGHIFSDVTAKELIIWAKEFLEIAEKIIGEIKA